MNENICNDTIFFCGTLIQPGDEYLQHRYHIIIRQVSKQWISLCLHEQYMGTESNTSRRDEEGGGVQQEGNVSCTAPCQPASQSDINDSHVLSHWLSGQSADLALVPALL